MSLTWDNVSAITEKYFVPKLADNIFDSNPYLKRIKDKSLVQIDGGDSIMVPLEYAQNSAGGWYSGADTLDISDTQVLTAAQYSWKQSYDNITVLRSEELRNAGDAGKLKLVQAKMKNAEKTGLDRIGTGLYSNGATAKSIVGLRVFVATSGTVGGISMSDNSFWQSNVDSTTTTLSMYAMQAPSTFPPLVTMTWKGSPSARVSSHCLSGIAAVKT